MVLLFISKKIIIFQDSRAGGRVQHFPGVEGGVCCGVVVQLLIPIETYRILVYPAPPPPPPTPSGSVHGQQEP